MFVVGVGMTKFEKPGRRADVDYPDMAREAGSMALSDAGVPYSAIQHVCVGYVYGKEHDASACPGLLSLSPQLYSKGGVG